MVWTAPMTFAAGNVLTAAQLNTHIRDNMLETAPAKATTSGGSFFVTQGPNRIAERVVKTARTDSTTRSTTSNSFTNLADVGPVVVVTTGEKAIVMISSRMGNTVAGSAATVGFEISGDSDIDANDSMSIQTEGMTAATDAFWGGTFYVDGLTPGVNIFTVKYKAGADTARFSDRFIGVIPL